VYPLGDVPDLDHGGHALSIHTCAAHVQGWGDSKLPAASGKRGTRDTLPLRLRNPPARSAPSDSDRRSPAGCGRRCNRRIAARSSRWSGSRWRCDPRASVNS
jgi:hypothetical protein